MQRIIQERRGKNMKRSIGSIFIRCMAFYVDVKSTKLLKMKRIFLILAVLSLLSACDEIVNYDFFVKNNCDKSINVTIVDYKKVETKKTVAAKEQLLVYRSKGFNKLTNENVESVFSSIVITKDNDTATQNYVDRNQWQLKAESDTQANCYLTIDSTDFKLSSVSQLE